MDMTYLHMPTKVFVDPVLSSNSKLILAKLFTLSKDGEQLVFCSREKVKEWFGIPMRSITRNFKELLDLGFLEIVKNPNKFSRIRYFKISEKTLSEEPSQNGDNGEINSIQPSQILHEPSQHGSLTIANLATSSIDRSLSENKCDLYKKETSKVTEEETKEWLSIPPVSEEELEPESQQVMEVKDTHPLIINSLSKTSVKEKSSAKREKNNKFTVPSYAEVVALITNWARVHMAKYPQLGRLDCALEAENFISYWESCGWKRKGQTIKSLNGTIATWLINALKYGNITVKSYNPAQDYRKTGLTREMNQEIAEMVVPKAKQYMEYLDKCEKGEEVHIKHRDEFEDLPLLTGRY